MPSQKSSLQYSEREALNSKLWKRALFLGFFSFFLLGIGTYAVRHFPVLSFFNVDSSPPPQPNLDQDETTPKPELATIAVLTSEEASDNKFRSGGIGLTRAHWEVLHGSTKFSNTSASGYQDNTYKVTYDQERVWQIEKSWGTSPPSLSQARTRIRRYLPLDSRLAETITQSDEVVVDVYRSSMLAQLLSPQPAAPATRKVKQRSKDLPTERCIVVHRFDEQKVTSTLIHIGPPRLEGYLSSSQTPSTTTTENSSPRKASPKESVPDRKEKVQRKS